MRGRDYLVVMPTGIGDSVLVRSGRLDEPGLGGWRQDVGNLLLEPGQVSPPNAITHRELARRLIAVTAAA